ncbi:MAG: type VI secretion system-associated FHA domain protein TagH, partial [Steroidobacteraceae bacterium]
VIDDQKTEWFSKSAPPPPELPLRSRAAPQRPGVTHPLTPPAAIQSAPPKPMPPPPIVRPVAPPATFDVSSPVVRERTPERIPARPVPERSSERAPARASGGARGDDALLREMLASAGIVGVEPSVELAQTMGDILRIAVSGLMEVQRARERMKDELRVRGTIFKPAQNNPLKFSANVEDAFHNLLLKHNPAYLDPAHAFEDAFHDVRDHHSGILAALRLAFESMLSQFDPARMQEEFDRQMKKGSILGVPVKLRYWDLYRDRYGDMVKDADTSFRHLFGDKFATEYEEQLERLKSQHRDREK